MIERSLKRAARHLAQADPVIAALIDRHGPCTMFDAGTLHHKTAYHVLVWAILNQQLSVASARSIERKLSAHHRGNIFRRTRIDALSDSELGGCGLSRQKISYIRDLGHKIQHKSIRFRGIRSKSNEEIGQILTTIRGVGPWTVDMFLMFYLGRLDVLPLGDLALRKAISISYGVDDEGDMMQIAARWRPYETVASWYLWLTVD